ncbi:hypothetical protein NPIL_516221 [Nephila pilipes]|uniref:Uncharacterized protein n=1 Tax=Nephila pilipes TaxID=299642 RepID=A0A8X6NCP7_NEPPI|nr:hypothetical protein NPIL_622471 [Nephila pilipes]GFT06267.1 hypothetical protein NPIL_516221 [Nephila pilipes]
MTTESGESKIQTTTGKEAEANKHIVTGLDLDDYKPSQLLQIMKNLGADYFSEKVLKSFWLDKMPDFIRNILLASEGSLDKLVIMLDKIHEMKSEKEVCAASPNVSYNDALFARIAALE